MAGDAYSSFKPGGSLKFKGGEDVTSSSGKKKHSSKKKRSSSHQSTSTSLNRDRGSSSGDKAATRRGEDDADDDVEAEAAAREREEARISGSSSGRKLTDAEKRFAEVQRKRMAEKIRREASKSHKERVSEFNRYLENLSEHHDLPKVGPG